MCVYVCVSVGGEITSSGTVKYNVQDSVYFIQTRFCERRQIFLDPFQWDKERNFCDSDSKLTEGIVDCAHNSVGSINQGPQVVIIDLGGHFVCGMICMVKNGTTMFKNNEELVCLDVLSFIRRLFHLSNKSATAVDVDLQKCLVIFNTTEGSYIGTDQRAPAWTYDTFFTPP